MEGESCVFVPEPIFSPGFPFWHPRRIFLLIITLLTAIANSSAGRTNMLHGVVRLILFLSYVALMFD